MTRPIITDAPDQEPKPAAPAPTQSALFTPSEPRRSADTLSGAFPAWDLVPMVHFVRRVK